jgi:ferritin-like metal-binding protein YciE
MTPEITLEGIRALSLSQLELVEGLVRDELKARMEKHKQETLAKIRELARSIDVGIKIAGVRGRPARAIADSTPARAQGGAPSKRI